jgi:hypothetical protein
MAYHKGHKPRRKHSCITTLHAPANPRSATILSCMHARRWVMGLSGKGQEQNITCSGRVSQHIWRSHRSRCVNFASSQCSMQPRTCAQHEQRRRSAMRSHGCKCLVKPPESSPVKTVINSDQLTIGPPPASPLFQLATLGGQLTVTLVVRSVQGLHDPVQAWG